MRLENWDSKLQLIIEETINNEKWVLGKNDCLTFPLKCIETITGIKVFDNKYKSLKQIKNILNKMRSKDTLGVALKVFEKYNFKQIDISRVQKGDVLYYRTDRADFGGTLGVCIGESVMFNWSESINLKKKRIA